MDDRRSRFDYHIGIKTDKEGNTSETPPVWLSDPIRLIGRGTDGTGSHYRIIEWKDRLTGAAKQAAVPAAEIGSVQGWQRLQSYGLTILSGRAKRERLADYLQTEGENTHYTVTARAGWHDKAYILPSGEVIRPDNAEAGRVIYNGDTSQAPAYEAAGTAQEWNAESGIPAKQAFKPPPVKKTYIRARKVVVTLVTHKTLHYIHMNINKKAVKKVSPHT